ncbi:hypothetical protein [Spiroplasma diminutum]|uniref:Uncharacterized protein n=1 Tax=Spiroplasma diminutum CUAS-1 TaxID=1276221 RepID=S5LZ55_9MOLU|nr:hypothetical protein [Spiroplasma diminutum]AGR41846.1 hypothetical protein SDIMI_v3c01420 [Spiroplasma diminutum CUAS-1]
MIFNKIEILYDKVYLPLKIKYSEIRKPTFMEFLILLIIIDHPSKEKNIKIILKEDFNISNQVLFERALRDLINFKVVEVNKTKAGIGLLNMNTSIDNFIIDQKIKEEFKKGTYTISHDNKFQDVKYFSDPVLNSSEILKDINWKKRINELKFSHKIEIEKNFSIEKGTIINSAKDFVKNKPEIFGDDAFLKDLILEDQESISDINNINRFLKTESIAIEGWLEIFENGAFKLKTEDKSFDDYLRKRPNISLEILKSVAIKYDEKIKKIFRPESSNFNENDFISSPDLISNLNIKTNYNLLLVNDQFIVNDNEFIKNKDLAKNIEIIIFYNSKRNNKIINSIDNKLIFYVGYIENLILQQNTFMYFDSKNTLNGFLIANKNIENIDINIPVVYSFKNNSNQIKLSNLFENNIKEAVDTFEECLLDSDYETAMNIYFVLQRIGLEAEVSLTLTNYLAKTIDSGTNYSNMRDYLIKFEDRNLILILEKVVKDLIIKISKDRTDDELFEIISNYKFIDSKNILEIFNKIEIKDNIENIYRINNFLSKMSIDGWKFNIRNSLIILTNYFKNNNRSEMFEETKYNSDVWAQNANTLNIIGRITKELYMSNYKFVEDNYKIMLDSIIDLIGNSLDINNFESYLINLSDSLIDFYKNYYKYKSEQFATITEDMIEYKIQLLAGNYINKIEDKLNDLIDKNILNMPIELKLEWIKNVKNDSKQVDKILKGNEKNYRKALNIIFGKKKEYSSSDLTKYINIFGGK